MPKNEPKDEEEDLELENYIKEQNDSDLDAMFVPSASSTPQPPSQETY